MGKATDHPTENASRLLRLLHSENHPNQAPPCHDDRDDSEPPMLQGESLKPIY